MFEIHSPRAQPDSTVSDVGDGIQTERYEIVEGSAMVDQAGF